MSKAEIVYAILVGRRRRSTRSSAAPTSAPASGSCSRSRDRDPERRRRIEARIGRSLGPVWEANHVWLIFTLVVLWTRVPRRVRGDHGDALPAAGAGGRSGSSCAGRGSPSATSSRSAAGSARARRLRALLADHPVLHGRRSSARSPPARWRWAARPAPFEAGSSRCRCRSGSCSSSRCAYIASVFLLDDCRRAGDDELADYFRVRAIVVAVLAGAFAAVGLAVAPRRRAVRLRRPARRGPARS